jgi:hypothetical protein
MLAAANSWRHPASFRRYGGDGVRSNAQSPTPVKQKLCGITPFYGVNRGCAEFSCTNPNRTHTLFWLPNGSRG